MKGIEVDFWEEVWKAMERLARVDLIWVSRPS